MAADDRESITVLGTVETLLDNANTCTFAQAKDKLSILVGKEIASLQHQLEKKIVEKNQLADSVITKGRMFFPKFDTDVASSNSATSIDVTNDDSNALDGPQTANRENPLRDVPLRDNHTLILVQTLRIPQ